MNGSLPTQIGLLTALTKLLVVSQHVTPFSSPLLILSELGIASLRSTIPTEIGRMTALQYISFYDNPALNGTLPTEIGNLRSMVIFTFAVNDIRGTIPTQIGRMTSLGRLQFRRHAPDRHAANADVATHQLYEIYIERNGLSGSIPSLRRLSGVW
jgi:hypothetical protein